MARSEGASFVRGLAVSLLAAAWACSSGGSSPPAGSGSNTPPASCSAAPELVSGGSTGPETQPSGCRRSPQPSAWPDARSARLGVHAVGDVLHFAIPAGTASLSIVSQATAAPAGISAAPGGPPVPNTVVPTGLTAPDGSVLFQDTDPAFFPSDPAAAQLPVYYAAASPWTGALTLPNTAAMLRASSAGLLAGEWTFTVNDYAHECTTGAGCSVAAGDGPPQGSYDITVLTRPGPISAQGRLDVAVYLATRSLQASSAPSSGQVQRLVSTLATLLSRGGLCLGTVTFYDLPDWAKTQYSSVDGDLAGSCDPLSQMFTLSQPGNTVNLFLVDEITSSSSPGFATVGQDGTIPGPSTVGGTVQSGAAISVADLDVVLPGGSCSGAVDLRCGADLTAYIAAHETGHWLGLYHTTESAGTTFDPLDDTPPCGCSACAANPSTCGAGSTPHVMSASECSQGPRCGGGENLMFWLLDTHSQGQLSAEQGQLMRANFAVQQEGP